MTAIAVLGAAALLAGSDAVATTCIAGKSFKVRQVCGQVKDFGGAAIPDASVELTKKGESRAIFTEQSDSDGKFHFRHVPDGDYELRVKYKIFWDVAQPFSVRRSRDENTCPHPIRVVMKVAGQCGYVENAWKKNASTEN
jgi:hypothetical protein